MLPIVVPQWRMHTLTHTHTRVCPVPLLLPAACYLLSAACCLLLAACCMLPAECDLLPASCCPLYVACCVTPAAYCLLPAAAERCEAVGGVEEAGRGCGERGWECSDVGVVRWDRVVWGWVGSNKKGRAHQQLFNFKSTPSHPIPLHPDQSNPTQPNPPNPHTLASPFTLSANPPTHDSAPPFLPTHFRPHPLRHCPHVRFQL